jgi:hypothetical protein
MCYDRNEVRQSRQISRKTPTKYTHSGLMERTRVALYALCKELNIKGMSKKRQVNNDFCHNGSNLIFHSIPAL